MSKKIAMVMLSTDDLPDGDNEEVASMMRQALQDGLFSLTERTALSPWKIDKVSVIDL